MLNELLCLFWIFLLPLNSFGQHYNFINYSVDEGMPQSQIYAIHEDHRGFLWFGTYGGGLSRFDGITFVNFSEEEGLPNNFIKCISEDNQGKLWIGTDDGLCSYDGQKFVLFTTINFPKHITITALLIDKNQSLWIGTMDQGIFQLKNQHLTHYDCKTGLVSNTINCFFNDSKGNIWIGTENGVNCIVNANIHRYTIKEGFPFLSVRSISEDKKGHVWFSSYGGGVGYFDHDHFVKYTTKNGLCSNTVFAMLNDRVGNMWFGTAMGVSRFNGTSFTTFTNREGLCGNVIVSLYQDNDLNLWLGSSGGGVSRFDNERFIQYASTPEFGKWIYAITQDKQGDYWFGTSTGGVTRYDGHKFKLFNGNNGLTNEKIKTVYVDNDGELWLGSLGKGIFRSLKSNMIHFNNGKGITGNFISGITGDAFGNIWYSSLDKGVGCFHKKDNKCYSYREKNGLPTNRANTICIDSSGRIWIGFADAGISRLTITASGYAKAEIATFNKTNGLSSNSIRSLVCYADKIYAGTSLGINILKPNGTILHVTRKNGLSSNNIYSLIFDTSGYLWAGTEKGIDRIMLRQDTVCEINHYAKPEGFLGVETTQNAVCLDKSGCIWFGTVNGAFRYNPVLDYKNAIAPTIHITGVNLFFDKIGNTNYAGNLSVWDHLPQQLVLPYTKNHLSFEFIGISFRNPQGIRYRWKLIGFDKNWSPVNQKREATYSNLPPGQYTFEVGACNENGIWNKNSAVFSFTINAPFWAHLWVQIMGAVLLLTIVWVIIYLQLQRLKHKNLADNRHLEMEKNILELEQATSRLQMNPHFVFNSLNSIQGYIASNDKIQAKSYLSKFAKLMRLILDNAREEFIPLKDEIDILENYLMLEQLRMNQKFQFTITIDEMIDSEIIEIPPMIVQPFVENAVLHGIKQKSGPGIILIYFSIENTILRCEITDNGIGRVKAREMKNISSADHRTSAISITEERLKRLCIPGNPKAYLTIIDLSDEQGLASGTKVIMYIPI